MNNHNKNNKAGEGLRHPAEQLILGVLAEGSQHGYDLYQCLRDHLGLIWGLGRSQTYALLSRLEQAGLVAHERRTQGNRPDRKVFSLTPAGREKFNGWVKAPVEHIRDLRLEFLVKIHFLERSDRKSLGKLISRQQDVCREKRSRLEERKRSAPSGMERLTYDFRLAQARAALDWLEILKDRMKG